MSREAGSLLVNAAALAQAARSGQAELVVELVQRQGELIAELECAAAAGARPGWTAGQLQEVLEACAVAEGCLRAGQQQVGRELGEGRDWRHGLRAYAGGSRATGSTLIRG